MAKRKPSRAKEIARKKKPTRAKKIARRKKSARAKKVTRWKKPISRKTRSPGAAEIILPKPAGLGPDAGGQSGDIEGLPGMAGASSESVKELAEEGQAFEAEMIDAVEGAPDPDEAELETREVSEDDVPREYGKEG
jgi:hypothetical protein